MKMPSANRLRRVGVLGGTFDPIHIGHLILAVEAWHRLGLDEVFLVPAGDPPHKQGRQISPVAQRLAMCQLAARDNDALRVSPIDAERPGPHYTTDTLRLFQEQLGADAEIYFLMGLDSLRDLPTWHNPDWLVQNCHLVALQRHDVEIDWPALEAALPGVQERLIILDMPELEISSTDLRRRVRAGEPIRYQVLAGVEEFIRQRGLYCQDRQRDPAGG